ncbi:hypothetical protein E5676_scaffold436G00070 [Cucumis melo var. makuwa]|uniref:Uncharacterized protein n=1 Tax=Cucumis melo var. makuwa TaxID=1194695 RepID=A0A5D3DQP2_CUCMM|nr:hypothetical protein E5676_scaffold436G00070 [Cucumis melo var. makuwa]
MPKLPKNRGSNLGGKEIRLVETMAPTFEEEVSGDDPDGMGSSALGVSDVPPLLGNNESLTESHAVDSAFEEVGTSKTSITKPTEQSLRPSTFLEEIRLGNMTVGGKDIESPPSKGDACPKAPLQKEDIQDNIMGTPFEYISRLRLEIATILLGIEKIHADGLIPLEEYLNSYLKRETLTLMEQLRGDAKVIHERATQLSLEKKELERRLQSINAESEQLSILSCEKAEAIDQQELEVTKLHDEVNTLESTIAITKEAIEVLTTVHKSMEAAREEFKNFKWKL